MRSRRRTKRASLTGTSSRQTSRSRQTASSNCWTSASPRSWQGTDRGRTSRTRRRRPVRDPGGPDCRYRWLHEPRAGARQVGGQTHRHLGVRLRAVRDALGKDGVPRGHGLRHHRRDSRPGSRLVDAAGRDAASRSPAAAALPREGSETAPAETSATRGWRSSRSSARRPTTSMPTSRRTSRERGAGARSSPSPRPWCCPVGGRRWRGSR